MKIDRWLNRKNIVVALVIVLVVAGCVGIVIWVSARTPYQIVDVSETDSSDDGQEGKEIGLTEEANAGDENVVITAQENVPQGLDPVKYVKQAYELKNFMAIESFDSAEDLPVGPTVQYAFCYLYSSGNCLVDYKPAAMTYRQASESQIREQIVTLFGSCPMELESSNLYSSGNRYFEMWQPDYSRNIYAAGTLKKTDDQTYQIEVTYFEDEQKVRASGTANVWVKAKDDGSFYLAAMS